MSISSKPYLIRALYEWCVDAGYTPYMTVWVDELTNVPPEFVRDNEIVLNINPTACQGLQITNDWTSFSARFGGVARDLSFPTGNITALVARETGDGMMFEIEPLAASALSAVVESDEIKTDKTAEDDTKAIEDIKENKHPFLRIIK